MNKNANETKSHKNADKKGNQHSSTHADKSHASPVVDKATHVVDAKKTTEKGEKKS